MDTLLDLVEWKANEHPEYSRGMTKPASWLDADNQGLRSIEDLCEECCVMTRQQSFLFLKFSHTSVFDKDLYEKCLKWRVPWRRKFQGGILDWNTNDEAILTQLHAAIIKICAEVGYTEFCVYCAAKGPDARDYWREMLGENIRYLKRWL
jgi:hypothetical protein